MISVVPKGPGWKKVVVLSENSCHFVSLLSFAISSNKTQQWLVSQPASGLKSKSTEHLSQFYRKIGPETGIKKGSTPTESPDSKFEANQSPRLGVSACPSWKTKRGIWGLIKENRKR